MSEIINESQKAAKSVLSESQVAAILAGFSARGKAQYAELTEDEKADYRHLISLDELGCYRANLRQSAKDL